jgi:hypothetical protein
LRRDIEINCNLGLPNPIGMKYVLIVLFVFLACESGYTQDKQLQAFVKEVIGYNIFTCADSVSKYAIYNMRQSLNTYKNSVFYKFREDSVIYSDGFGTKIISVSNSRKFSNNHIRYIKLDSIKLSETEIKDIDTEITKMNHFKWDKELFTDATLVPTDTINQIFGDRRKGGWTYLNAKGISKLYNIAPPIFLRNDTYCLFYYDYGCGDLCGQGEFALYKKENGRWVKWFSLFESIS